MNFRTWLLRKLDEYDLNQSGLAARLRINHATVGRWTRGLNPPGPENIEKLSRLFSTPPDEIYRLLGRLPPLEADDPEAERRRQSALFVFDQLRPEHQDTLLMIADGLLEQQERTRRELREGEP